MAGGIAAEEDLFARPAMLVTLVRNSLVGVSPAFSRGHDGHYQRVPTATDTQVTADWEALRRRLAESFPEFSVDDVLTEIVHAHDAVAYVGTPEGEQYELVEFMARYGLMVRSGRITPSDRLDPERHASPRRDEAPT